MDAPFLCPQDGLCEQDVRSIMLQQNLLGGLLGGYQEQDAPFLFINARMLAYLGYETQQAFVESIDGLLLHAVHPEDRAWVEGEVRRQKAAGVQEYVFQNRMLRADGSYGWITTRGRTFLTQEGRVAFLYLCLDITGQKELENQLTLYRLASQGGTFILRVDDACTLLYGNDIFYDVIGYTPQSLREKMNNSARRIVCPQDDSLLQSQIYAAVKNDDSAVEFEMRVVTGTGKVRWIQVRGAFEFRGADRVLNGFVTDVDEQHQLAEEIQRSEERYRIALHEANISVWEYDIPAARLIRAHGSLRHEKLPVITENVPQALLTSGLVHPDSASDLLLLYQKIAQGAPRAEADLRNCAEDGKIWWEHLTFTTVFDGDKPVRAIAVGEDITRQKEAEINYQRELQTRDTFTVGFVAGSRANLTKNEVEFIQTSDITPPVSNENLTYDAMVALGAGSMTNADDRERYYVMFSRAGLLEAFAGNRTTVSMDYRRKGVDGKISWVNAMARLVRDALTGDVYSYSSIQDISEKKALELALRQRAERDSLTGAYNKETMMRLMEDALAASCRREQNVAVALFHIDHFTLMVQKLGYAATDIVVRELFLMLESELPEPKLVGRLFGDEMLVFLGGETSRTELCERTERVLHLMSTSSIVAQEQWQLTVSAGLVLGEAAAMGPEELVQKARDTLAQCRKEGGNRYSVYQYAVDCLVPTALAASTVLEQPTAEADSFVLRCASSFARYDSFSKAATSVLRSLVNFCGAASACLLEFEPGTTELRAVYEWLEEFQPERAALSPLQKKDGYSAWPAMLTQRKFFRIESRAAARAQDEALAQWMEQEGLQSFYAQALEDKTGMLGYLAVISPAAHAPGMVLLQTLSCFIEAEIKRRRLARQQEYYYHYDTMTGLESRNSYLAYIEQFQPDSVISMAVLSVDINGLKSVNMEFGHGAGDRLVCFIADQMRALLTGWHVYRIAGDEFLAICENITADATQQALQQLRDGVNARYPGSIATGSVWAETDLHPEELVNRADESMTLAKQAYYQQAVPFAKHYDANAENLLMEELKAGRYRMYLQPKASIALGAISGAEALVRYCDADGRIVPPDRFIPQMERNGTICHIDLFMFEEVCRTLQRWQQEGLPLMPVSLNFSRSTLLAQDLISRVESIYQRYTVPRELVEIEITESMGSVERETIIRISGEIVKQKFHLALDDFGARYSNLSILSAMKLHVLKLDKSLVNDLYSNHSTRVVVKSFLAACHELEIHSVAEGVETKEQLDALRELGCEYAQGYYFNKPIPCEEFERLYLRTPALACL